MKATDFSENNSIVYSTKVVTVLSISKDSRHCSSFTFIVFLLAKLFIQIQSSCNLNIQNIQSILRFPKCVCVCVCVSPVSCESHEALLQIIQIIGFSLI